MSAHFARIKHLLADGVFRRLVDWFFIVWFAFFPMTIYELYTILVHDKWHLDNHITSCSTVAAFRKVPLTVNFFQFAGPKISQYTICTMLLSKFVFDSQSELSTAQFPFEWIDSFIFLFYINLIASTDAEPNSNEINLNSNAVLSLFIFKQPSGSETKLKFKMELKRAREWK